MWGKLKERKAFYVGTYGASFLVTHELLGIASYGVAIALVSSGAVDVPAWIARSGRGDDLRRITGLEPDSPLVASAAAVLLVKAADLAGLVPLRWALSAALTPWVARRFGPRLDRAVSSLRSRWRRKPPPPSNPAHRS